MNQNLPPPPPGFVIQNSVPPPPPGFILQEMRPPAAAAQPIGKLGRFGHGMMDPIVGGAQLLERATPAPVRNAINNLDRWLYESTGGTLGSPAGADQYARDRESQYQGRRQAAGSEGFDAMRLTGNIASPVNVAAAAKLPVAASLVGRALQGGAIGGAMGASQPATGDPEGFWGEKGMQTGIGAGAGAAMPMVTSALGRALSPGRTPDSLMGRVRFDDVKLLQDAGVRPTAAQIAGGHTKMWEEAARSTPVVGSMVNRNMHQTLNQFNRGAMNRAVAHLGREVKYVGQKGMQEMKQITDDAYAAARNAINRTVPLDDPRFQQQLAALKAQADDLPNGLDQQWEKLMTKGVGSRLTKPNGRIVNGDEFKMMDEALGDIAARMQNAQDPFQRQYGELVRGLRQSLRDQVGVYNPQSLQLFNDADLAYAQYAIIRKAADSASTNNSLFTPNQLQQAAKAADKTVGHGATTRGEALLQDLADAGQNILGNKLADSGTAARGTITAAAAGAGAIQPWILAALAGSGAAYGVGNPLLAHVFSNPLYAAAVRGSTPMLTGGAAHFGAGPQSPVPGLLER